jgi:hypothetical protein
LKGREQGKERGRGAKGRRGRKEEEEEEREGSGKWVSDLEPTQQSQQLSNLKPLPRLLKASSKRPQSSP